MGWRTFEKLRVATAAITAACLLTAGGSAVYAAAASGADVNANARDTLSLAPPPADDKLQSEWLFDLIIDRGPASPVGPSRVVVPVAGGTFAGPKLKGSVVGPGGDWISVRPDGASVLDLRVLLQTDDGQKIYMTWRGVAYTLSDKSLFARVTPVFETSAPGYAWLNNVVAVGVFRQVPGKVAYRIYRIL